MKEEKDTGVDEISTDPELTFDDLTEEEKAHVDEMLGEDEPVIDDDDDIVIGDEEEEQAPEPEPEKKPGKTDGWQLDDYKKHFENAEKIIGKQGQELGELRKKVATVETVEPTTPEEKIRALTDTDLNLSIEALKADILKPNATIDDEEYGQKVILYNDLKEERTMRKYTQAQQSNQAQQNNSKTIADFEKSWTKTLGADNLQEVVKFAKDKLSDQYGNITSDNLEVALHALYPAQFKQAVKATAAEQTRERIVKAEATKQPRLSGAGNSATPAATISINKLLAMDEVALSDFLAGLDMKTVGKIEEAMKKYKK